MQRMLLHRHAVEDRPSLSHNAEPHFLAIPHGDMDGSRLVS